MESEHLEVESFLPAYVPRLWLFIAITLACIVCLPSNSYAEPDLYKGQMISVNQQIRPGTCYDLTDVNDTFTTIDYISAWECQIQR